MKITNENKPAFPISEEETDRIEEGVDIYTGLTKREYFAGQALQGLCVGKITSDIKSGQCVDIANEAVIIADALLKALQS